MKPQGTPEAGYCNRKWRSDACYVRASSYAALPSSSPRPRVTRVWPFVEAWVRRGLSSGSLDVRSSLLASSGSQLPSRAYTVIIERNSSVYCVPAVGGDSWFVVSSVSLQFAISLWEKCLLSTSAKLPIMWSLLLRVREIAEIGD